MLFKLASSLYMYSLYFGIRTTMQHVRMRKQGNIQYERRLCFRPCLCANVVAHMVDTFHSSPDFLIACVFTSASHLSTCSFALQSTRHSFFVRVCVVRSLPQSRFVKCLQKFPVYAAGGISWLRWRSLR